MDGGTGNDTYVVDSTGDMVIELNGGGIDTVEASINYTLGNFVENLTLTGTARIGIGNTLDNVITGNAADNVLTGGGGNDRFVFKGGTIGHDTITDFSAGDKIDLTGWLGTRAPVVTTSGQDALIDLGGGNTILVANLTADHLLHTSSGYSFI